MADTIPNKPEKPQPDQGTEVDRYERLQVAADRQINKIGDAYETHASLIKVVVIAGASLASIIAALIGFGFYHSMAEFKQSIREDLNTELKNNIATLKDRVELEINERFQRDNIVPLIEAKVQGKVDLVTKSIIENEIHKQIDPVYAGITNHLEDVEKRINEANISSTDVKGVLDLAMDIVMALNDDRHAFDKLLVLRDAGTNRYKLAIYETINNITTQNLPINNPFLKQGLRWDSLRFNPDTNSWKEFIDLFNHVGERVSESLILQNISEQTRFPRYMKLHLYRELLTSTPSLKILSKTCEILDNESHLNFNILGKQQYLDWINTQLRLCLNTNPVELIGTNVNEIAYYYVLYQQYISQTNYNDALNVLNLAVEKNPTSGEMHNACAWLLAVCPKDSIRNGRRAVELAQKACILSNWKQWNDIGTLAAAYAEAGDFEQAIKYEIQAINTDGITAAGIKGEQNRLKLFKEHKPTHERLDIMY